MTRLLAPRDENELMILRSVLECEGIAYQIQNEHFGGLYPGLNIFALNERIIFVDEDDYQRAWVIVRDFLKAVERPSKTNSEGGSISTIPRPVDSPRNTDTGA